MSAFLVSKTHVCAIVKWAQEHGRGLRNVGIDVEADVLANQLFAENVLSVTYRYPEDLGMPEITEFKFSDISAAPRLTAVECLKACQCLEYQSCEHPEWATSQAKRDLGRIKALAITKLPGYEDAEWAIYDRKAANA